MQEIVTYCIDSLLKNGLIKAQCQLQDIARHELSAKVDKISLFRTTYNTNLNLTGILNDKKISLTINKIDKKSIAKSISRIKELALASVPDSANDISEKQPAKVFSTGQMSPQPDIMYEKLKEFLAYVAQTYPSIILEEVILEFAFAKRFFQNSNQVDYTSQNGVFNFSMLFASKEGKNSSSFNYSGFSSRVLDKEIKDYGSIDMLLRQSTQQVNPKSFKDKMLGEIIITPDCIGDFINFIITNFLSDYALITGNSIFKDKLNEAVADSRFSLHSKPISEKIANNYFFTNDGYEAQNSVIIEKGILKSFLLSLYGSKKTGKQKAVNEGGAYIIDEGDKSLQDMIKSIKRGILLCRFSGGNPSENGDFSGVAKNSYYIEDGEIKYPIKETMIA